MSRFADCQVDPQVVRRARQGEMAAHETLYRVYSLAVFTLARRMVPAPEIAEEILQETFVEVIRKIGDFRDEAPLGAWIRSIAVNKSLMYLRSAWHRYARAVDPEIVEYRAGGIDSCAPAVDAGQDLEAALASLTPTARAVVWLYDVEGFSHREIAERMGRSVSFSKSQLARAHQRMREVLEPEQVDPICMPVLNNS